jgi:hypothetical protein
MQPKNTSMVLTPEYPFHSHVSIWAYAIKADTDYWIDSSYQFLPEKMRFKYKASNFGKITARCLPHMPTYEHLQAAAMFMLWGTVFDDYYEFNDAEAIALLNKQVVGILSGEVVDMDASPFFPILQSIYRLLKRLMPSYWLKRFTANVSIWIGSMIDEVPFKAPGQLCFPTLEKFLELRERTIGVQAYLDLIEMQLMDTLPDEVMYSPYMKEAYRLAARVFGWCNDFYSVLKDIGREPLNLVLVMQNEYSVSLDEAARLAMLLHDDDVKAIIELSNKRQRFGLYRRLVRSYMYYLGVMIQGQNQWYQQDTLRYQRDGYPVAGSFGENAL